MHNSITLGELNMRIRWHGHACFEVGNGVTVVTDPHDGKAIGIRKPDVSADIVLVSHDHFDHNCARIVKGEAKKIDFLGETTEKGVKIFGTNTYHDEVKGDKRGPNIVYKFIINNVNFCHLGDLGHILDDETAEEIGKVDVLFIPVGNVFTINGKNAWQVIDKIKPKIVVPMHYRVGGLSLSIRPLDDFLMGVDEQKIVRVGNEIDFEKEDLPKDLKIWVFTF